MGQINQDSGNILHIIFYIFSSSLQLGSSLSWARYTLDRQPVYCEANTNRQNTVIHSDMNELVMLIQHHQLTQHGLWEQTSEYPHRQGRMWKVPRKVPAGWWIQTQDVRQQEHHTLAVYHIPKVLCFIEICVHLSTVNSLRC